MPEANEEQQSSSSTESTEEQQPQDPILNLKAEMSRKQSNVEAKLAQTNAQLEQIMAMVQQNLVQSKPAPAASGKSARDLLYDSPDEFIEQVTQQATSKAQAEVARAQQMQSEVSNAIMEISAKYPEFSQAGSEAAQKAVELGAKLPKHLRGTAEGAKIAMLEAAADLGLVPASRRQKQSSSSDDAAIGGGSSRSSSSKPSGKAKIDDSVIIMGKLLGVDYEADKNRAKNLEQTTKRSKWNKYE